MSVGGFSRERLGRMRAVMAGHVEHGGVPGLVMLLSRRGEVHVEAIGAQTTSGDAPMRRDTIFRIASMTKPIVAAAAMILVEECKLRLDDPVDGLLPELAHRQVLKRIDAELDETEPARRAITLRDLLTFKLGFGAVMAPPDMYPIQKAIAQAGLGPSPFPSAQTPEAWMKSLGALPLIHQPGEGWLYHTGSDVLGVLIARASGQTLDTFLRERLFEPLGMKDTGFFVPADELDRLPAAYAPDPRTGALALRDEAHGGSWAKPPVFASGGGGLVSTVDDYLAFCQMMLNKGRHGRERILSRPSVELMTMDHLTPGQKVGLEMFFGDHSGWGFGMGVTVKRHDLASPGQFGWTGGLGTIGCTDPREEMIGILMTQRMMTSAGLPSVMADFWTSAYAALDD